MHTVYFDIVPHGKLLHKMKLYGVGDNSSLWLSDFLTNKKMNAVVDGEKSDSVSVESGVPQNIVFGPLLFLCHTNNLPDAMKSTVRLFADDCFLYRSTRNMDDYLARERDLQQQQDMGNALQCKEMLLNEH